MRARILTVSQIKTDGCEPEEIRTDVRGILRRTGDGYSLRYTEQTEGGTVSCTLSFSSEQVTLTRTGALDSSLCFRVGYTHAGVYRLPPLSFPHRVTTRRLSVREQSDGFLINIEYESELGGAAQSAALTLRIVKEAE